MNNLERLKIFVSQNMKNVKDLDEGDLIFLSNLKSEYFCFDTESCRDEKNIQNERVYSWILSNTLNDFSVYGETLEEFLNLLKSFRRYGKITRNKKDVKTKALKYTSFVHNLGWDIEFFKYTLDKLGYKYYSKIMYDDDTIRDERLDCNCYNITENNGQVYNATIRIKVEDWVQKNKTSSMFVEFKMYDSFKIMPKSLDKIAKKVIKVDDMFYKLSEKYDYKKVRPYGYNLDDIEKCYLFNDGYLLKEFIKQYYIANNFNGFTASGIAFNNLLKFLFPNEKDKYKCFEMYYPPINDSEIIDLIDRSYSGGFTYANSNLKGLTILKHGFSLDINSSYPHKMKCNIMPYGTPKYFKGEYKFDKEYPLALQEVHFDYFKRKNNSNIGFIKIGSCENIIHDVKNFDLKKNDYVSTNMIDGELITTNYNLVWTYEELQLMLQCYDFYSFRKVGDKRLKGNKNLVKGLEYTKGVKFKGAVGHFGKFIDDCVFRKNKAKDEENNVMYESSKVDMNSVYGKLGSSFKRDIKVYEKNKHGIFEYHRKYENPNDWDYIEDRKYYRAYSSFTTSYGRMMLFKVILEIEQRFGSENFVYCDTDSIYATITEEQLRSLHITIDGHELGAWDIEKEFFKIKTLGAKKYIVYGRKYGETGKCHNVCKCAGLPDSVRNEINFNNFNFGTKFKKLQKKKVIGGYRLENTEFTIKDFTFY